MRQQSVCAFKSSRRARTLRRGSAKASKKAESLKPKILEFLAKKFGSDSESFGGRCPGASCERLEGVGEAGWTIQEQWEEAGAGCPRKCAAPLDSLTDSSESEITDEEAEYFFERIEDLVFEYKLGNLRFEDCEFFEWELVKYWIKTVDEFENGIQISLQKMIHSFLYPKE